MKARTLLTFALVLAGLAGAGTARDLFTPEGARASHSSVLVEASAKARYPITHIVIIDKENRSFDNIFGRFPGADGTKYAITSDGKRVPLGRTPDHTLLDIGHAGDSAAFAVNDGRMNQFDLLPGAVQDRRDRASRTIL